MIQKLRRKFILINMLLVTTVLLITMGILFYSRVHQFHTESRAAMRLTLHRIHQKLPDGGTKSPAPSRMDLGDKGRNEPFNDTPIFLTILNDKQEIADIISTGNLDVTDTLATEAVKAVLASSKKEGYLPSLKLRFILKDTSDGTKIAFADTVQENRVLANMLSNYLVATAIALVAFFAISVYLSQLALKPIEQAWEQQNRFIADASHELKTPLTVILANLRILRSHPDSTILQEKQWVENTQTEAERMKELLENLLFLARSDASHTTPATKETFSLNDLLWNGLLSFEPVAFEQGVTFTEQIEKDITFHGDYRQFKQLVSILLDNACKYAEGEKKVRVLLYRESGRIILAVHNTGTPLSKEALDHIFERFYRADQSRNRKEGGYGLGLSIAQTIVKNHGGKIKVKSDADSGTAFLVILPSDS